MFQLDKKFISEGDIVECACGELYRYTKCRDFGRWVYRLLGRTGWLDLNSYDNKLKLTGNYPEFILNEYEIVNIYKKAIKTPLIHTSSSCTRLDSTFPPLNALVRSSAYISLEKMLLKDTVFINLQYYV